MSEQTVIQEVKAPKVAEFSIAAMLEDLKNGIDRKAQAVKYGVPLAVINRAYLSTPLLKGKKVHKERAKRPGSRTMQFVFTDADQFTTAVETTNDTAVGESPIVESPVVESPAIEQAIAPTPVADNSGW